MTSTGFYVYRATSSGNNYDVNFNSDGTYNSYANLTTTDCNVSIATLYSQGRAFQTVGGGSNIWTASGANTFFSGGNVGIGTTNPSAAVDIRSGTLQVKGTSTGLQLVREDAANSAQDLARLRRSRSDSTAPSNAMAGVLAFELEGFTNSDNARAASIYWGWENNQTNDTTDRDSYLAFRTMADAANESTSGDEHVRITSAGNVGIGTTAPGQKLSVAGTIESTSGGVKYPDGTTQTTSAITILHGSATGSIATGLTRYTGFGFSSFGTTESGRELPLPMAGTISKFYFNTNTAHGSGGDMVCMVRKNGADTTLLVTIPADAAAGTFSDTSNSLSVAAGDRIVIRCVNASSGTSATVVGFSAVYRY